MCWEASGGVCGVVDEEEDINTKVRLDKRMKLNWPCMTGRHYTFSSFNKHIYKHGGNTDFVPVRQRYEKTLGSDQSSVRLDLNIYKNWFSIIFFVQFIDF